jgi:hypothetical protein
VTLLEMILGPGHATLTKVATAGVVMRNAKRIDKLSFMVMMLVCLLGKVGAKRGVGRYKLENYGPIDSLAWRLEIRIFINFSF